MGLQELSWSPTAVWTTGTPASVSQVARAYALRDTLFFVYNVSSADGNAASQVTIPSAVRPSDQDLYHACEGYTTVDGTPADLQPYIEMANATATSRVITSNSFTAWTDAKTSSLAISGFQELESGIVTTFSPTLTWGTATPGTLTTKARFINMDGVILFTLYNSSADANGVVSSLTSTMPTAIPDTDTYIPICGYDQCTAGDDSVDYDNMLALLDSNHATEASRTAVSKAIGVAADGKAILTMWSGIYEAYGWGAWTPTWTFTGTAPTASANVGRYKVIDNAICFFTAYHASTDYNGVTALAVSNLPIDPAYIGAELPITSVELQNTTSYTDPLGFIACDEQANSDRTIQFKKLTTMTDAAPGGIYLAGWYPIG